MFYKDVLREEQMSIKKFGDDYKQYMEMAPRMNSLLASDDYCDIEESSLR